MQVRNEMTWLPGLCVVVLMLISVSHPQALARNEASVAFLRGVLGSAPSCTSCRIPPWVEAFAQQTLLASDVDAIRRARIILGGVYLQRGEQARALEQWQRAESAPFWERMSVLVQSRDMAVAIEYRRRAISVDPNRLDNYFVLAALYWPALNRADAAIDLYLRAAAIARRDSFEKAFAEGWASRLLGNWLSARDGFERAVTLDPTRVDAYRFAALAAQRLGAYEAAVQHLQQALTKVPKDGWTASWIDVELGDVDRERGGLEEALRWYGEAGRIQPENPGVISGMLSVAAGYEQAGRVSDAVDVYRRVIELDARNAEARSALSRLIK